MIGERKADIDLNFCQVYFTEFFDDPELGSIIAMQNLASHGYRNAINKKKGLSPEHVRLALAELAKYHACGYAWAKSHRGGMEETLSNEEEACALRLKSLF